MHRMQQPKEQFYVSDTMDPRDPRVMWAHSYETLPPSPGSLQSAVMPRPPRLSLAKLPSSNVIDMDEGCWIINALQEHALPLHQMTLVQGVVNLSDPRHLEPSTSPGEMSVTCPFSSFSRNSLRLACMLAPTFVQNPEYANAEIPQHCEGVKEQC